MDATPWKANIGDYRETLCLPGMSPSSPYFSAVETCSYVIDEDASRGHTYPATETASRGCDSPMPSHLPSDATESNTASIFGDSPLLEDPARRSRASRAPKIPLDLPNMVATAETVDDINRILCLIVDSLRHREGALPNPVYHLKHGVKNQPKGIWDAFEKVNETWYCNDFISPMANVRGQGHIVMLKQTGKQKKKWTISIWDDHVRHPNTVEITNGVAAFNRAAADVRGKILTNNRQGIHLKFSEEPPQVNSIPQPHHTPVSFRHEKFHPTISIEYDTSAKPDEGLREQRLDSSLTWTDRGHDI